CPQEPWLRQIGTLVVADPFRTAAAVLADARDVTLLSHVNPDADSLGSALALGIALRRRGAAVRVAFASPPRMPETLRADADVARCLYAGLVTDTRGFRTAGADAHRLAAELIDAGVDPEPLVRPIMDTHPFGWLSALGAALARAELDPAAAGGLGLVHTVV